ncbi:MAG: hypothetical protein OHK0046_02780 [Anaerolineae bacterium]
MGINVRWDRVDPTLIVIAYTDPWLWKDFHAAMRQLEDMVKAASYPVSAVISDYTQSRSIPANVFSHFHATADEIEQDPNETLIITVGATGMWLAISKAYHVLYPHLSERFKHVGNMAEARAVARRELERRTARNEQPATMRAP